MSEQKPQIGYAAISPHGEIRVATVSPTERAAMVNALVNIGSALVTMAWADEDISNVFASSLAKSGWRIRRVRIEIDE